MRTNSFKLLASSAALLILAGSVFAQKSSTGQGIQVTLSGGGAYTYTATENYKFNEDLATTYYTNALVSGPTISASGKDADLCAATFAAATPAAPAPDINELGGSGAQGKNGVAAKDRCNFLDGGALTTRAYSQSVTQKVVCGSKTYNVSYTWDYTVTPNVESVDAWTCWELISSDNPNGVEVSIGGDIVGESAQSTKQHPLKYSFSLADDLGLNRVTGLVVSLNGVLMPTTSSMVTGADFTVTGFNAGTNGNTGLLKLGDARTILNTDSFPGNNNGGANGAALAYASMSPVSFAGLLEGDYTVVVTGTVKGNAAAASTTFAVNALISVVTPGCGGG